MSEKPWGCLKQTAAGCAAMIVFVILFTILLGVMITRPFNRAVDARAEIEERFGPQEAYVPPLDGAPTGKRIEVFIEIRKALSPKCADFANAAEQVAKLESFDDQEEVNRVEVMKQAFSTTRSMMGVGPLLGKFYEARNQSLLDSGMGLGEFTYLFVVAYRDQMLGEPDEFSLFGPTIANRRVRQALLAMLENQRAALLEAGGDPDTVLLDAEIAAMKSDEARFPWQDGLPPAIVDALDPYRESLDEFYCPATAPLELMINVKHGPSVEGK